jgi:cobalamin-dependent methionine synthase I
MQAELWMYSAPIAELSKKLCGFKTLWSVSAPSQSINQASVSVKSIPLPLCIDSTDPETVEAALRIYPGRALINSISAEKVRLEKVLPVAAKYGAAIIALPLTDAGIPAAAAERMQAVDKIISAAMTHGYLAGDIIVDALIMSVASDPLAAKTALEVIGKCSSRGIKTVCGLSNVSFGMPDRTLLNRTFLALAMGQGLTAAIANPLFADLMAMVKAGDALLQRAKTSVENLRKSYEIYRSAAETARNTLECNLHEIEKFLAAQEALPTTGPGYTPSAVEPPRSMKSDFRA